MNVQEMMDLAAGEAIGANGSADSALFAAVADDSSRRVERELRETVARLAAASPGVVVPAELRGRVLQATAPATFRMEDYRKATRETGRFYRWGFYAAMLFLMAGAYFNVSLQSKLKEAGVLNSAQAAQVRERDQALTAFVNPEMTPIYLTDEHKHRYGVALVDEKKPNSVAVVVLPDNMVPANRTVQLTLPNSSVAHPTVLVRAPADSKVPAGKSVETAMRIKTMEPEKRVPQNAIMN